MAQTLKALSDPFLSLLFSHFPPMVTNSLIFNNQLWFEYVWLLCILPIFSWYFPPAVYERSICSISSQTLHGFCPYHFGQYGKCVQGPTMWFWFAFFFFFFDTKLEHLFIFIGLSCFVFSTIYWFLYCTACSALNSSTLWLACLLFLLMLLDEDIYNFNIV